VPHDEQNLAPGEFSAAQLGHLTEAGASEVPQEAQNLAPAELSVEQLGHFTPGAACAA
jgi:hypothetical protein